MLTSLIYIKGCSIMAKVEVDVEVEVVPGSRLAKG